MDLDVRNEPVSIDLVLGRWREFHDESGSLTEASKTWFLLCMSIRVGLSVDYDCSI
jgi:hypothetical protein